MSFAGFGRSKLPFDMFNLKRSAAEAKRAEKLANIYHRGQELAWDGRKVLGDLMERHGGVHMEPEKAQALSRLFGVLMWGELAAWKISAELADGLVPLEAKMAATAQVHDEARHFYVLHDYLAELGQVPTSIDRASRAVLDLALEADDLCSKLMGMQLLIETLALTLFQAVRELNVDPVLSGLMRYFEKDEARHVGLGVQYLPSMLKGMPRRRAVKLLLHEVNIMGWAMAELKVMEPDLRLVGLDPRQIFTLGTAKQALAFQALGEELGKVPNMEDELADRLLTSIGDLLFPLPEVKEGGLRARLRAAVTSFRGGLKDMPAVSLDPEAPAQQAVKRWSERAS
jgi:hypothetical protein